MFKKLFQNVFSYTAIPNDQLCRNSWVYMEKKLNIYIYTFRHHFVISNFTFTFSKEWYFSSVEKLCPLTIPFFTIFIWKVYVAQTSPTDSVEKLNFTPFQTLWRFPYFCKELWRWLWLNQIMLQKLLKRSSVSPGIQNSLL